MSKLKESYFIHTKIIKLLSTEMNCVYYFKHSFCNSFFYIQFYRHQFLILIYPLVLILYLLPMFSIITLFPIPTFVFSKSFKIIFSY